MMPGGLRSIFFSVLFLLACVSLSHPVQAGQQKQTDDSRTFLIQKDGPGAYLIDNSHNVRVLCSEHVQCLLLRPAGYSTLGKPVLYAVADVCSYTRAICSEKLAQILYPFHFFW